MFKIEDKVRFIKCDTQAMGVEDRIYTVLEVISSNRVIIDNHPEMSLHPSWLVKFNFKDLCQSILNTK